MLPDRTRNIIEGGIKPSLRPKKDNRLSGVVMVSDRAGTGYSYIKFDDRVVEVLGAEMPMGVGEAHPAYIQVVQRATGYAVICRYVHETIGLTLWVQDELPAWVKTIRRAQDGKGSKDKGTGNGERRREA